MKKIFIMFGLIFLVGCGAEYNLTFENDRITEEIIMTIPNSILEAEVEDLEDGEIEENLEFLGLLTENFPVFIDSRNPFYEKKIVEGEVYTTLTLKHNFRREEFLRSATYNMCFENASLTYRNDTHVLSFSGRFACYYGGELVINITTPNVVNSHNADSVKGRTYTWIVTSDNFTNLNLEMEISSSIRFNWRNMGILLIVLVIIAIPVLTIISKIKNREEINEV